MGPTNRPVQCGGVEKPQEGKTEANDGVAVAYGWTPPMEALRGKPITMAASSTSILGKCTTPTRRQLAHATQKGLPPAGGAQTGGEGALETLGSDGEDQPSQSGDSVEAALAFGQDIRRLQTTYENDGGDLAERRK